MAGIVSYGAYIPWNRLERKVIFNAMGWYNPAAAGFARGEKAVAGFDEDSVTMAVAAGMDCLSGAGEGTGTNIEGLYLASTTLPHQERQNAGIAATALGMADEVRAADMTGSLKCGMTALLSAYEAVKAGEVNSILTCAADSRLGKPGSVQEYIFGDGAVSFLVGSENVIAELEGSYSLSCDFVDHRRAQGDMFDKTWEDRWIRDEGYSRILPQVINGIMEKYQLKVSDLSKIVYPCHYDKLHSAIVKKLNAGAAQVQDNMMATVGDTGAAHPLLMLAGALEEAQPGEKILVAGYGNGGDALLFRVTEEIENFRKKNFDTEKSDFRGVNKNIARKRDLGSYEKYTTFRNILPVETGIRGEVASTALSVLWRERRSVLGLEGTRCKRCGTPQYPPQKVCVNPDCHAAGEMEPYSFAGKTGVVFSYTADNLAYSPEPPAVYGIVEFDGKCRFWFDFTDCEAEKMQVGTPVKMNFRRKYLDEARSVCGYFWKAVPLEQQ